MKNVVCVKELESLVNLLRSKAVDMAKRSEGNDNKKGWWQAGKADGYGWAADHLSTLIESESEEVS